MRVDSANYKEVPGMYCEQQFKATLSVGKKFKTSGRTWKIEVLYPHHCICTSGRCRESFQYITLWLVLNRKIRKDDLI